MTLMEILVALTLLMIVIVGTTPVMLSAFDGLYTAGEYTQKTYNAKTEIEDQLATRSSSIEYKNFKVNYENLGAVAQINAKRAVSSLTGALETLFTGGRAYVTIVSGDRVNDDSNTYEITVKISNYQIDSFSQICDINDYGNLDPAQIRLAFKATLPNKKSAANQKTEEAVYDGSGGVATIEVVEEKSNLATGLVTIKLTSDGFSFTKSPVQIKIYYYDENDEILEANDYLHIKTPTILFAGSTVNNDYYTTAGVQEDGSFTIKGRKMDISNATGTIDYLGTDGQKVGYGQPADDNWNNDGDENDKEISEIAFPETTIIRSVNWISEYEEGSNGETVAPNASYESNYYVLAGTNGVIYRTYSYTGADTVKGKLDLGFDEESKEYKDYTANKNGVDQDGKSVVMDPTNNKTDKVYDINNGEAIIYPAVWGGDFSHIFAWSASKGARAYSEDSWYTQKSVGVGQDGYYSNRANYSYYYNGFATEYKYQSQNGRTISYILTEKGYPLRIGGFLEDPDNYAESMNIIWENPEPYVKVESLEADLHKNGYTVNIPFVGAVGYPACDAWYRDYGELKRCVISTENGSSGLVNENANLLPVYFANNVIAETEPGKRPEHGLAQIKLKGLTTLSPRWLDYRSTGDSSLNNVKFGYNSWVNQSRVTITDAIYIPGNGVLYLGNVAAYGAIYQNDNASSSNDIAKNVNNNEDDNTGSLTCYYVLSNDTTTATSIYKYTTIDRNNGSLRSPLSNYNQVAGTIEVAGSAEKKGFEANDSNSKSFFVTRAYDTQKTTSALFEDVLFTMGFSSNREIVYSGITFDVTNNSYTEHYKSYEQFYFLSEYGNKNKYPNSYVNANIDSNGSTSDYLNKSTNDYYNVWFPSEMYNLTKVATKGDVTVAVGYAVSGSTYQYVRPNATNNTSTALGGIFNDGVMSAMVLGQDSSFKNLLYFKDNGSMDKDYLTSNATTKTAYTAHYTEYGTHTRNSVQFTAVDISVVSKNNVSNYYAYYADNHGRLFRSLVATQTGSEKPQLVSYISSLTAANQATAKMEKVLIGNYEFSEYFDKITSIKCEDDYIIVSGHSCQTDNKWNVAIGIVGDDGSVTFKKVSRDVDAEEYCVEDVLILNGYVYFVGVNVSNEKGWIYAHSLEDLKRAALDDGEVTFNANHFVGDENLPDAIYAIDGHS